MITRNTTDPIQLEGVLDMGFKGDDGITPHIGENGNWWIGDTDTGVPSVNTDAARKSVFRGKFREGIKLADVNIFKPSDTEIGYTSTDVRSVNMSKTGETPSLVCRFSKCKIEDGKFADVYLVQPEEFGFIYGVFVEGNGVALPGDDDENPTLYPVTSELYGTWKELLSSAFMKPNFVVHHPAEFNSEIGCTNALELESELFVGDTVKTIELEGSKWKLCRFCDYKFGNIYIFQTEAANAIGAWLVEGEGLSIEGVDEPIPAGDERYNLFLSPAKAAYDSDIVNYGGDKNVLTTEAKASYVAAINELAAKNADLEARLSALEQIINH